MKKVVISALLIGLLTGCVAQHANFVRTEQQGQTIISIDPIVKASLEILQQRFPPAHSSLKIAITNDSMSAPLITQLRQLGYAVYEISPQPQQPATPEGVPGSAQRMAYFFDVLDQQHSLYQLTIQVDKAKMSTVFKLEHGQYKQVSPWTIF